MPPDRLGAMTLARGTELEVRFADATGLTVAFECDSALRLLAESILVESAVASGDEGELVERLRFRLAPIGLTAGVFIDDGRRVLLIR